MTAREAHSELWTAKLYAPSVAGVPTQMLQGQMFRRPARLALTEGGAPRDQVLIPQYALPAFSVQQTLLRNNAPREPIRRLVMRQLFLLVYRALLVRTVLKKIHLLRRHVQVERTGQFLVPNFVTSASRPTLATMRLAILRLKLLVKLAPTRTLRVKETGNV